MHHKLQLQGNIIIFQLISTRDKFTGKYLPMMDGNLNVTLNRIYNDLDKINHAFITLPVIEQIDKNQLFQLISFVNQTFENKITFLHLSLYGDNVDETRQMMMSSMGKQLIQSKIIQTNVENQLNTILFEVPVDIRQFEEWFNYIEVIYNYNWSYCSNDEQSNMLKSLFIYEQELAKTHITYLYSDVQYQFWKTHVKDFDKLYVFRSSQIFSKKYIMLVADYENYNADKFIFQMLSMLDEVIAENDIVFYPMRIEDPRYQFEKILMHAQQNELIVIITNPTNYDMSSFDVQSTLKKYADVEIIDLSKFNAHKRQLYFHILQKLAKSDVIIHHEKDMHISFIEQTLLTNASIISNFSSTDINSYIKTS